MTEHAPTDEQQAAIDAFTSGENTTIIAGAGSGKTTTLRYIADAGRGKRGLYLAFNRALREDQPVATPTGWRPIGDLRVGDLVLGRDGKPHAVTKVHDRGIRPMNRVVFSDDTEVIADDDHLWTVDRTYAGNTKYVKAETIDTRRVAELVNSKCSVRVPLIDPLDLPVKSLPLDPYILGVLLGDGSFGYNGVSMALSDPWVAEEVSRRLPAGAEVRIHQHSAGRAAPQYGVVGIANGQGSNPVRNALVTLDLAGRTDSDKFVPDMYLWASAEQRLDLLRGLMDTDGCAGASGGVTPIFTSTSPHLAEAVAFLARSLGGSASLRTMRDAVDTWKPAYQVTVRLPGDLVPFLVPSKRDAVRPRTHDRLLYRKVVSVAPEAPARAVCISIDTDDHLFLTAGLIPTHNSVRDDAVRRFAGTEVEPLTVNQLAYRAYGPQFRARMNMKRLYPHEKKRALGMETKFPMGTSFVSWQKVLRLTQQTLETYCRSFRPELEIDMVELPPTIIGPKRDRDALKIAILHYAKKWWADWMNPNGLIEATHSTYMKRWALDEPQLPYDYLLVDEAQDLEPLTRGMLLMQDTQVIVVGDPNQAIYGWRGATSALDDFEGQRTYLTQSWRFGDAIAEEANFWLNHLDADMRIKGHPGKASSVWKSQRKPEAVLTRTNGGAMREIIDSQAKGLAVGVAGVRKAKELIDLAQAALDLQKNGKTKHRDLEDFTSWADVIAYVEDDASDTEIAALVRVVDTYGAPAVVKAMENTVPLDQADQTVSTVHVAKGLEWWHVRIADDFREPGIDKQTGEQEPLEAEEARLAYVAVTRAQRHLDASGLDWAKTMTGGVAV